MKTIATETYVCDSRNDIEGYLISQLKDQTFEITKDSTNFEWLRKVPEKSLTRGQLIDVVKLHSRIWLIRPGEEFHWFKLGPHTYRYSPEGLRLCVEIGWVGTEWLDRQYPNWRIDLYVPTAQSLKSRCF